MESEVGVVDRLAVAKLDVVAYLEAVTVAVVVFLYYIVETPAVAALDEDAAGEVGRRLSCFDLAEVGVFVLGTVGLFELKYVELAAVVDDVAPFGFVAAGEVDVVDVVVHAFVVLPEHDVRDWVIFDWHHF